MRTAAGIDRCEELLVPATFETGSNFDAWIHRIVSNEYFSRYRQARRRGVERPLDETPGGYPSGEGVNLGWHATVRSRLHRGRRHPSAR